MNGLPAPTTVPSRAILAGATAAALTTVAAVALVFGMTGYGTNVDYSRQVHLGSTPGNLGPPASTPYRICGVPMFEQLPC